MPDPLPRPLPVPDTARAALLHLVNAVWSGWLPDHDAAITAIATPVVAAEYRRLAEQLPEQLADLLRRRADALERGAT